MNNNEEKIKNLEEKLNAVEVVDPIWFRSNHSAYKIVCLVNNIIALRISKNYKSIPVFIYRINKFLSLKKENYLSSGYIDLVNQYIHIIEVNYNLDRRTY